MVNEVVGKFDGSHARVGVVVARFNSIVTERLEKGALDCLRRHGVSDDRITVVRVPGAFEIAGVARKLLHDGVVDGVIGLGCVIRGETAHYDYICEAAIGGLAAIARETGQPVTCGVLTVEDLNQALHRTGGKLGHKGAEAAQALLECCSLQEQIEQEVAP
jgi:6,7-dimethyl-8-ribityllumazine synthase